MTSINQGIGLRGRGQRMFDQQRQVDRAGQRDLYGMSPDMAAADPVAAYMSRRPVAPNVPDVSGMQAFLGLLGTDVNMKGGPSASGSNQLQGLPANSLVGDGSVLDIPRQGIGSTLFAPGQSTGGPRSFSYEQQQAGEAPEGPPLRGLRRRLGGR